MNVATLIAVYALGVATPILIQFVSGYIAGIRFQWRILKNAQSIVRVREIDPAPDDYPPRVPPGTDPWDDAVKYYTEEPATKS